MIGARSAMGLAVVTALLLFGCAAAGGTTAARTAAATPRTATLVASDDAYVDSSHPAKRFAAAGTLQVGAHPVVRSYLKFDFSSINGTTTRAVLKLTALSASKTGFAVRDVPDSSWSEARLRYANAPAVSRPLVASSGPFAAGRVISIDVTASFKAGTRTVALVARGGGTALSIASSENARLAARPKLVVTYTPLVFAPAPPRVSTVAPKAACGTVTAPPTRVDHVIWIFMENKPYDAVIGSPSAPYVNQLAASCGLATNYHGITHPSLPNYIAATSGGTQGIADDDPPSAHPLDVPSIFSQVKAAGKTWRSYQEGSPGNCTLTPGGLYAVKHDPAAYFTGIRSDCAAWDVPMGETDTGTFFTDLAYDRLPAFSFVTPDLCADTHDCSVATGDSSLQVWFARILASSSYLANKTVVFLVWDEDDGSVSNHVPAVVVSPSTPAGTQSGTNFDHYALLKTTEQLLGITTYLGHAGDASTTSMVSAFNLG